MDKYNIDQLIIEVGRKCNMRCPHCLRGEAEDLPILYSYIKDVLTNVESIGSLTITGGEPFLYPSRIEYIVDLIERREIPISSFFVATNGTVKSFDIVKQLLRLYEMCKEKEFCELKISDDSYHDKSKDIWCVLDGLAFARRSGDMKEEYLLSEGRAADNYDTERHVKDYGITVGNDGKTIEGIIYVAADGNILTECDYSYANQPAHSHGNLRNASFAEIMEKLIADSPAT